MTDKLYVCDTNILLDNIELVSDYKVVLLSHVLRELEKHKISHRSDLAFKARKTVRYIKNNKEKFIFDTKNYNGSDLGRDYTSEYEDDNILKACLDNKYGLISNDLLLQMKAEGLGIEVIDLENKIDEDYVEPDYKGYKEVYMSKEELQEVYNNLDLNKWDLLENEYLIVLDEITGEGVDCLKWDGFYLHKAREKGFTTQSFGKFKPFDFYQKAAVDSIFNNDITMLTGVAGTGKSLIALNVAWHLIERGKYDQLVIFTNPVKTRNAEALGFYKGDRTTKLMDAQTGIMLSSKFGDKFAVEREIDSGKLQLLPFSDIRGFDTTSEKRTIVWFIEAQNTNIDLMKLGLERIGNNTKVIIDGDPTAQVDLDAYRVSNGMTRTSEVFRGYSIYGEVQLKKIYRSIISELASKM